MIRLSVNQLFKVALLTNVLILWLIVNGAAHDEKTVTQFILTPKVSYNWLPFQPMYVFVKQKIIFRNWEGQESSLEDISKGMQKTIGTHFKHILAIVIVLHQQFPDQFKKGYELVQKIWPNLKSWNDIDEGIPKVAIIDGEVLSELINLFSTRKLPNSITGE